MLNQTPSSATSNSSASASASSSGFFSSVFSTFHAIKQFSHLPRESRDTLFLLMVVMWVLLPQIGHLPWWTLALAAVTLFWRAWLALGSRPLPSRYWLVLLVGVSLLGTFSTHKTLIGRDAGVTLVVVLLALKTLELRARRDAFVVFFLSFFTMLTNFFFSQSLLTALAMLLALLGLLTALVNAHRPVGQPSLRESALIALKMTIFGAPIMVALFVLFPRLPPLWGLPSDHLSGRTGLSSKMEVGNMAKLALDDSIALRVRFDTPNNEAPPQHSLYFRGPVLSKFDGRIWLPNLPESEGFDSSSWLADSPNLHIAQSSKIDYEVTLEPHNRPWLLTLDATGDEPKAPELKSRMSSHLQWLSSNPVTELLRYKATSYTIFRYGALKLTPALRREIEMPADFNPRTRALAQEILNNNPNLAVTRNNEQLVAIVLDKLKTGGYQYTLEPGVYGVHTADEFWFDRKEGFCEHIASSFVILMRAMGIPARVVTGYQGGEMNQVDRFWVVRQSDAHAWAEVWQENVGWIRVDPTSAVAPSRTGNLERLQPSRNAISNALLNVSPSTLAKLRATWEAVNNRWNQWILNYSQSDQFNLLKNLGFGSPNWRHLGMLVGILVSLVSLFGIAWAYWERIQHDPWLRLLRQVELRLHRLGLPLPLGASNASKLQQHQCFQTPRQLANASMNHFGENAQAIHDWLLQLERLRYASTSEANQSNKETLSLKALRLSLRRISLADLSQASKNQR